MYIISSIACAAQLKRASFSMLGVNLKHCTLTHFINNSSIHGLITAGVIEFSSMSIQGTETRWVWERKENTTRWGMETGGWETERWKWGGWSAAPMNPEEVHWVHVLQRNAVGDGQLYYRLGDCYARTHKTFSLGLLLLEVNHIVFWQ